MYSDSPDGTSQVVVPKKESKNLAGGSDRFCELPQLINLKDPTQKQQQNDSFKNQASLFRNAAKTCAFLFAFAEA